FYLSPPPPSSTLLPYTTLFRSLRLSGGRPDQRKERQCVGDCRRRVAGPRPGRDSGRTEFRQRPSAKCFSAYRFNRPGADHGALLDRKSTRLNSSHVEISYAVFC